MRDKLLKALLAVMRGREGAPQMPDSLAVKWMPTIEDIADAFGPLLAGGAAADARAVTWREVVSASYQIEKLHPFFRGTFEQLDKHLADALGHTRDDYGAGRISVARTLVERARRELTAMCALGVVGTWPLQTSEGLAETTDPSDTAAYREGAALAEAVRTACNCAAKGIACIHGRAVRIAIEAASAAVPGDATPAPTTAPVIPDLWPTTPCGHIDVGVAACAVCGAAVANPAPDALRERAIRVVAEAQGWPVDDVRGAAAKGGPIADYVAIVVHALRDEREAAYQRARADAAAVVRARIPTTVRSDFENGAKQALEAVHEEIVADAVPVPFAPLNEVTRMEIAHALTLAMHLYAGHKIDSRGPTGCIYDALRRVAPAVAADLDETLDYSATYARFWEDGQLRPGKCSGAETAQAPALK